MRSYPRKATVLVFTVDISVLQSLAVFCMSYTKRYNSHSETVRLTWSSAQSKVSNFKFIFMVILYRAETRR